MSYAIPKCSLYELFQMSSERIMPYPAYLENNVAIFLGFMLPMFTILSFCFIVPPLMKRIVHEKQTGVKVTSINHDTLVLI